jgi:hypothetical protein
MAKVSKAKGNSISFLDHSLSEPMCQKIIQTMNSVDLNTLGVTGKNAEDDKYHF